VPCVRVAGWLDRLTIAHLFMAAIACGTSAVFFNTACHAYVPTVLDRQDLADGNAKLQVREAGTRVLGRSPAGFIAQAIRATVGLLLDALTFPRRDSERGWRTRSPRPVARQDMVGK
jgi:hypothetical protein